jgi:hypothetical protein
MKGILKDLEKIIDKFKCDKIEDYGELKVGWKIYETVGMSVINDYAITKISFNDE